MGAQALSTHLVYKELTNKTIDKCLVTWYNKYNERETKGEKNNEEDDYEGTGKEVLLDHSGRPVG